MSPLEKITTLVTVAAALSALTPAAWRTQPLVKLLMDVVDALGFNLANAKNANVAPSSLGAKPVAAFIAGVILTWPYLAQPIVPATFEKPGDLPAVTFVFDAGALALDATATDAAQDVSAADIASPSTAN